jgi:class 3 adenylate cyclase
MTTPRIQYVTTADGVRIAYAMFGEGDGVPVVMLRPALFSNVEAEWQLSPQMSQMLVVNQLSRNRRVLRLDVRGCGLSDRDVADRSLDARVSDVATAIDRVGFKRFAIDAHSEAGLLAIAYSAHHPDRVSHLVLTDSWLRGPGQWDSPRQKALDTLREADWQLGTDALGLLSFGWTEAAREFGAYSRGCLRREDYFALRDADWGVDLKPLLPRIVAPTLVCTFPSTAHMMRADLARDLMSGLSDARLVSVRSAEERVRVTEEFLDGTASAPLAAPIPDALGGAFRTIVFTDLEGHTDMMQRLGDERGRDVLRVYENLTREALREHGGTELKALGDGFMASFPSATRALQFAAALQRAVDTHAEAGGETLRVRIGVNAGEPIAEGDDLFGTAVILAARVAAEAIGGQVLVADVVRQLVAGKGLIFAERGETRLAGITDTVRIWEYIW